MQDHNPYEKQYVLFVEPEPHLSYLFEQEYKDENIEVIGTKRGQEAIDIYNTHVDRGNARELFVFIDVGVIDVAWHEIVENMFQRSIVPPIIVIDREEDISRSVLASKTGARDYIVGSAGETWSISPKDLYEAIQKNLDRPTMKVINEAYTRNVVRDANEYPEFQDLVLIRTKQHFDQVISERNKKVEEGGEIDLFDLCLPYAKSGFSDVNQCRDIIEHYFEKPIAQMDKANVLIIEDEEMVRKATYDTVSVFYNVVAEAPSCEIAIEKFKSHSDIDIALLDVYLLDGTGIELYPKLSSINLSPVFIVTTAFQETEVAKQLIEDGAYDYINKPFSQAELHKMMGRAWYHKNWPHLEDVLDIRNRRFIERMYFLNFVIEQNKLKNRKTVISDIYGLFPELVDHIFVKKSLWD